MDLKNQIIILVLLFLFAFFRSLIFNLPSFFFWKFNDIKHRDKTVFKPYGLYMFCGRQGSGKTMSLVWYLERLRRKYPLANIYTNFGYKYENAPLKSLNDLLDKSLYNGEQGTIFVFDEIQNEFSCQTSKNFPESVLSVVTQQRKQKILILSTSQVFTRVAKPLREQCFYVFECLTFFGRYTKMKMFDADIYNDYCDNALGADTKRKMLFKKKKKYCFVQTDRLRNLFDSYALISRLSREGFNEKLPVNNSNFNVNFISHKK